MDSHPPQLTPGKPADIPAAASSLRRPLNRLHLVGVIFFVVSGGAYGLESLVGALNPGWAVLLLIATPVLWALPVALMVAELASALPEEGGYYVWVRKAMGDFWGFQEGWWTICYTAVDMAIYPVLFVDYLGYFVPSLSLFPHAGWPALAARWMIALAVIATACTVNWRGARPVGDGAVLTLLLVLGPFALLAAAGLHHHGAMGAALSAVRLGLHKPQEGTLLAVGMSTALWNYCGWDNVSTFAEEVRQAPRNYPPALAIAMAVIVLAYLAPVLAGIAHSSSPALWNESTGWPAIARAIGGPSLGVLVAAMALVSAWSMFNSQLLYASRLPYAMARDGWLPAILTRLSSRTGMPSVALIAVCLVASLFAALSFTQLVVIDILMYSAGLLLEFLALIVLRARQPQLKRPFRVPGGHLGLLLVTLCPMSFAGVVVFSSITGGPSGFWQLGLAAFFVLSGMLVYASRQRIRSGKVHPRAKGLS